MIWDSRDYKKELRSIARQFSAWEKRKKLKAADFVAIEKATFFAAYVMRKLMDAKKLSRRVIDSKVGLTALKNKKPATLLNWHRIDELYDFSTAQPQVRPLRFLCNQLIHSYVFMPTLNERGGLSALHFTSDQERNNQLFRIDVRAFSAVLQIAGGDHPRKLEWRFNKSKGDFEPT